jgi:hypothetical protein
VVDLSNPAATAAKVPGAAFLEPGSVSCPPSPSAGKPCTVTINVHTADIGGPTTKSLLEEVGSYSLASAHPQGATTNAQALADHVPLQIDGACCFNFRGG